jgi:hypothetical protein
MKIKYYSLFVGSVFAVICLICTLTMIVPLLSIIPLGLPLELLFSSIFTNSDYGVISISVFLCLTTLFLFITIILIKKLRKEFSKFLLIYYYLFQLILIHPMVFYFWAILNSSNAGDGQFAFGIIITFPISSLLFIPLGLIIDLFRIKSEDTK